MKLRHFLLCAAALLLAFAASASAQTAEEILEKSTATTQNTDTEGLYFEFTIKIPIIGAITSKNKTLGDKMRIEVEKSGVHSIQYSDGTTSWDWNVSENTVTISDVKRQKSSQDSKSNLDQVAKITEGYAAKIKKEDAECWYIRCEKTKDNTNKDDPKSYDVVVAKDGYLLKSLKSSMKGITIIMENFRTGVSEEEVTFDLAAHPGVQVVDKRGIEE